MQNSYHLWEACDGGGDGDYDGDGGDYDEDGGDDVLLQGAKLYILYNNIWHISFSTLLK
jgi:hypothetical protein